jgi:hypothetical protein
MASSIKMFDGFKSSDGVYSIGTDEFREIINNKIKTKRPQSAYFMWLNGNRQKIRETYFDDFESIKTWDSETLYSYYKNKELGEPKKGGKPRIVGMVAKKAGIIWKTLSEEEKKPYVEKTNELKKNYIKSKLVGKVDNNVSDDENINVEEMEEDGKMYYLEKDTCNVFDPDTEKNIGKFIDNAIVFN